MKILQMCTVQGQEPELRIPGLDFLSSSILKAPDQGLASSSNEALKRDFEKYKIRSLQELDRLRRSAVHGVTASPIDPMDFWIKENRKHQYETKFALLSCDIMAIPASSVPCERMFSVSGLLSSGKC